MDPQPWTGGVLVGRLIARCYSGWKLAVIGEKEEELTGILTKGGVGQQSVGVGPAMKGKNKVELSPLRVMCWRGGAKLERGMSAVKNRGAPGRCL
jgi:hypothetical protein